MLQPQDPLASSHHFSIFNVGQSLLRSCDGSEDNSVAMVDHHSLIINNHEFDKSKNWEMVRRVTILATITASYFLLTIDYGLQPCI